MKRKLISLLLAAALCLSLSAAAFAATDISGRYEATGQLQNRNGGRNLSPVGCGRQFSTISTVSVSPSIRSSRTLGSLSVSISPGARCSRRKRASCV